MRTLPMLVVAFRIGLPVVHKDGTEGVITGIKLNEWFGVEVWNAEKDRKEGWHVNATFIPKD